MISSKRFIALLSVTILGVGISMQLSGCASPVTGSLLHHCEGRIERAGPAISAYVAENSLYVEYTASQNPRSHSGITLKEYPKWMKIEYGISPPRADWDIREHQPRHGSTACPVYYYGRDSSAKDRIQSIDDDMFIVSETNYHKGFTLFYPGHGVSRPNGVHFSNYTELDAPK